MPTYHYRCTQCEQHLEVVQSMFDDPLTECAACGGEMQKVLRPVGIVLKGSGFYRTDNRKSSGSTSDATTTKSDSSNGSKSSSDAKKSESKSSSDSKKSESKSSTPAAKSA